MATSSALPVVTLFYGFNQKVVSALKAAGKLVLFQVGTLEEARRVTSAGGDGVIVQGMEAGGHIRGNERLADLLPKVREALPNHLVVGAGGVHDRASARTCRLLGADAVCSGTRFLASPESSAHAAYKQRLVDGCSTVLTNLFGVGWRDPHRVLKNGAIEKWCDDLGREPAWLSLAHKLTRPLSKFPGERGGAAIAMVARQSLRRPLYTPSCLTVEMREDLVEIAALYAGECVSEIKGLQSAAKTVGDLAS